MRANLFALAAMLALVAIPARADGVAGTIHVDITGFRNDNGQVLCDLYSSPEAFPGSPEHADAHTVASIAQGRAACEFHNVTPGRYAIGVVHDENKNGSSIAFWACRAKVWGPRATRAVIWVRRSSTTPRSNIRAARSISR